jgi:phosphate:Na+ symporter
VRSGILRAFGADLRGVLGIGLRNRFTAFLAGLGITTLLQSSTATALMTATFVGDGFGWARPGLGHRAGRELEIIAFAINLEHIGDIIEI